MASGTALAPNTEPKSAKKKKRDKSEGATVASAGTAIPVADDANIRPSTAAPASDLAANGVDGAGDSPYLKELNK